MKKTLITFAMLVFSISANAQISKTDSVYGYWSNTHPGCLPGEVFLTNISTNYFFVESNGWMVSIFDEQIATEKNFSEIRWESKRLGSQAYTAKGELLSGMKPVFVKKSELIKAGILKK